MIYYNQLYNLLKSYSFIGNDGWQLFLAFLIFIGISIFLYIFRRIVLNRLKKFAESTDNKLDDILVGIMEHIGPFSYPVFALFLAFRYLDLPAMADKVFSVVFICVLAIEIGKAFGVIFDFYVDKYLTKDGTQNEKKGTKSVMQIVKVIILVVLWAIVTLLILSNLGVNVTSVIASMGIGGIAVALAVQNVLKDMLSSLSIYIDKPFTIGDFIVIGTSKGTVEKIGLKTTRLRSINGEELIISNNELTSARINNFKRVKIRRDSFIFGVTYETPANKLKNIPAMVEKIITGIDKMEIVRCRFETMADFSLNFKLIYTYDSSNLDKFADAKQELLLAMVEKFATEKIDFAYPTQEVIVRK